MRADLAADWPAISALLDEALALEPNARAAWLANLPPEHQRLREVLTRLLARGDPGPDFLAQPPTLDVDPDDESGHAANKVDEVDAFVAGQIIGPYRLERPLGRGGMGAVWLARRVAGDAQIAVALKLPHISGRNTAVAERFERERAILSTLNHANIARLYEAGVADDGQPYLALEYVDGEPLLAHCEHRGLDIKQRLQLFIGILRAVQYAHASLVIHRDLKPANIVVTSDDTVKLLDFGIAKLLDRDTRHTERTRLTRLHGQMLTLDYASPEQVLGEPLTTGTDIYSLGVVLYELLTGLRPYRLRRGSAGELEDAIVGADLLRPSQLVGTASGVPAGTTTTTSGKLRRQLRGDLDTIVMKALEKDRSARYVSAEAFAQDCTRYLQGLPVLARPQSRWYRWTKFTRRHRLGLGAAAAVLLAVLTGLGLAISQARIAANEARKQQAVQSFVVSLFDRNTRLQSEAKQARSMTVRDMLIEASDRIDSSLVESPPVKLELLNTLARLLREVDEYERSAQLSRAAISLAKSTGLTSTDAHVEALMSLATVARVLGNRDEAIAARDESLRILDARGDRTSLLRARANINTLAQLAPDPQREISLVNSGAALFEQRYPNDPGYFNALWVLGNLYRTQQQPQRAAEYFQRGIEIFDRVKSKDFTNLGASYGFLALTEFNVGKIGTALDHYARGMKILDQHAGQGMLVTRFHRGIYASLLQQSGQTLAADSVFADDAKMRPDERVTVVDFDNTVYQAAAFLDLGQPRAALELLTKFNGNWVQFGRAFAVNGARWVVLGAQALAMQGRVEEARQALARIAELTKATGEDFRQVSWLVVTEAWIDLLAGTSPAATSAQRAVLALADSPPALFDLSYVQSSSVAAEISIAKNDYSRAISIADRGLTFLHQRSEPPGLPFEEARLLSARAHALLLLGRRSDARVALLDSQRMLAAAGSDTGAWVVRNAALLAAVRQSGAAIVRSAVRSTKGRTGPEGELAHWFSSPSLAPQ